MGEPLPPAWDVPAIFRGRLGDRGGRQRCMAAEGHCLLILHRVPRPDDPEREEVFFWRDADGDWTGAPDRGGFRALRAHLESYEAAIDGWEERERQAEDADSYFAILQAMGPIHRASRHLLDTLQAAREAVPGDRDLIVLRDRAGEIERAADLLYRDSRHGLDFLVAKRAEEQARIATAVAATGNRLNLMVTTFLPLTALASVFGMNLAHGLPADEHWPFWAVLVGGLLLGYFLRSSYVRELKAPEPKEAKPPRPTDPRRELPVREDRTGG